MTTVTERARELSHADIEKVLATIDIPACPAIVTEVMQEAQCDNPNLNRLARRVAADPSMLATALKLANSPMFCRGEPLTDVREALMRIGMRNVVCVVIAVALRSTMTGVPPAFIEAFWSRNARLAQATGSAARRAFGMSPDAAYTYALFHNAAVPLMVRRYPEYRGILEECSREGQMLAEREEAYFPCTHAVVGSLIVRNWGLPSLVGKAIRLHHDPELYDLPDETLPGGARSLIAITHIAEHLLSEIEGSTDIEVGDGCFERALAHFGFDLQDVDALRILVQESAGAS